MHGGRGGTFVSELTPDMVNKKFPNAVLQRSGINPDKLLLILENGMCQDETMSAHCFRVHPAVPETGREAPPRTPAVITL
ncbi:hypothetical protein KL86PLE_100649 [uncultured Pleomorphomonas sp.]|uniref:Uncharacterized protein n=1 Tax=uncultured Pleomorphomonas sp. TaxID=442121 RepID=A0A212L527_9HYPH|nr:hypothetical protein KL86PLE_100649 [uncultured Pleomorphomonas sp.]